MEDLIWFTLNLKAVERPSADELLEKMDQLEQYYFGQVQSKQLEKRIMEVRSSRIEDEKKGKRWLYCKKSVSEDSTYSLKSMKRCPEFFSRKVGEKLLKVQSINEMVEPKTVIKMAVMNKEQ